MFRASMGAVLTLTLRKDIFVTFVAKCLSPFNPCSSLVVRRDKLADNPVE